MRERRLSRRNPTVLGVSRRTAGIGATPSLRCVAAKDRSPPNSAERYERREGRLRGMGRPALLSMEANGSCGSNLSFREGLESGRRQRAIAGRRVYENEEPGFGRAFRWVSHRVENARRDLGSSTVFPVRPRVHLVCTRGSASGRGRMITRLPRRLGGGPGRRWSGFSRLSLEISGNMQYVIRYRITVNILYVTR